MVMFLWAVLLLAIAAVVLAVAVFNGLVRKRNSAKNAFAQIDVQLKRRHDLIPNLVETAKKYLSHEADTLTAVTEARNQAVKAESQASTDAGGSGLDMMAKAEGMLSKALGRFYAVAENYPELKADAIMVDVMDELKNTENRIGFARQAYNDAVMFYNNAREVFPNNIIAGMFGFLPMSQLQFEDAAALNQAPKVSFSN